MNWNQELFWLIHTNVFGLNSISLCAVEGGSMRVINCTLRYIGASSTECSLFGEMFVRQTQLTIDFYNKSSNPHGCCPRGLRHSCPLPVESVVAETSTLMPHPLTATPLWIRTLLKSSTAVVIFAAISVTIVGFCIIHIREGMNLSVG